MVCPVCSTKFGSLMVCSTNRVGQDTDFRPHVAGSDPLPHYVHACPHCFFAAFEGDFEEAEPEVRDFVLGGGVEGVGAEAEPAGSIRGSSKYLLASVCYERDSRATRLRIADLYLRASWCSRAEGDALRERQCQIEAVGRFEAALAADEVARGQEQSVVYLVGELYRRVGRYELAEVMLERAAQFDASLRDERLARLARQQLEVARQHRSEGMEIDF